MKFITNNCAIITAILGCVLFSTASMSATLEDVDQRLKKLEEDVTVTQAESENLANRLKNNMSVTGYADTEYITTNEPGKDDGFRIHHLSLFFKKQISEDLRFFSEIEFEDGSYYDPTNASNLSTASIPSASGVPNAKTVGSGKIFAEAVNFDYQWRPSTSVRIGRFFTPAGIWSVDHYPPFVTTQDRPQHIRKIFPQLVDGASLSGNHAVGSGFLNYDLYTGNGETTLFDGAKDNNSTKAAGLRVSATLPIAQHFEIGATVYRDKLKLSSTDTSQSKKDAKGIHTKIRQGPFGFQAEYAKGSYEPTIAPDPTKNYDSKGYYGQFTYDIKKWTLGLRHDVYDEKSNTANDEKRINSAFVNYHVNNNVVLKWEHHLIDVENPANKDYYKDLASIVVYLD